MATRRTKSIEQHYSRADVARLLGVSSKTVTRYERKGLLRALELPGGAVRYPASSVAAMLYERPQPAGVEAVQA